MSKGKVLIVDDEPLITTLISTVLENEGYDISTSNSPEEGLELVINDSPDLLILDIGMPKIDGYEFCRRLKAQGKLDSLTVVFLSGKTAEEDAGRSFELGAATYIRKPFANNSLKEIVNLTMLSLGHG
jgi:DNA-binding response OmpR family regulator